MPEPHAQGYTLQGQSSGGKPIDSTDWSPSEGWTAGQMISTVDDLLVYGRALGTGKGLLSSEKQSERLDSFVSDVPPLNKPQPVGKGEDRRSRYSSNLIEGMFCELRLWVVARTSP